MHASCRRRAARAALQGRQFASIYNLSGEPTGHRLEYGRYGNPKGALGEALFLGRDCRGFASGMAAVARY